MITASRKRWEKYLTDVREYLPQDFEDDVANEILGEKSGAYIFVAFITDVNPKECADNLIEKLGVDDGEL